MKKIMIREIARRKLIYAHLRQSYIKNLAVPRIKKKIIFLIIALIFVVQADAILVGKSANWQLHYKVALVSKISFSNNSQKLVSANSNGKVQIWDVKTGRLLKSSNNGNRGMDSKITYSPDAKYIIANSKVLDAQSLRLKFHLAYGAISSVFSADSKFIVAAVRNKNYRKPIELNSYSVKSGRKMKTLSKGKSENYYPSSLYITRDNKFLIVGVQNKRKGIEIWNIKTGKRIKYIKTKLDVTSLTLSPNEKTLAIGGIISQTRTRKAGGVISLYNFPSLKFKFRFTGLKGHVTSLSFHPNGKVLASSQYSSRPSVQLWDVVKRKKTLQFKGVTRNANQALFSPDGRYMGVVLYTFGNMGNPTTLAMFEVGSYEQFKANGLLNDMTTFHKGQHLKVRNNNRWYSGKVFRIDRSQYLLKMDNRKPEYWLFASPKDLRLMSTGTK